MQPEIWGRNQNVEICAFAALAVQGVQNNFHSNLSRDSGNAQRWAMRHSKERSLVTFPYRFYANTLLWAQIAMVAMKKLCVWLFLAVLHVPLHTRSFPSFRDHCLNISEHSNF